MPAATAEYDAPKRAGTNIKLTVPNGLTFFAGTLAAFNTSTNAVVKATDAANTKAIGTVERNAAETEALVINREPAWMKNSSTAPLTIADFGDVCLIEDDTTVAKTSTNSARAGVVLGVETVNGQSYVLVDFSNNF
jgi:hypothetical protein